MWIKPDSTYKYQAGQTVRVRLTCQWAEDQVVTGTIIQVGPTWVKVSADSRCQMLTLSRKDRATKGKTCWIQEVLEGYTG